MEGYRHNTPPGAPLNVALLGSTGTIGRLALGIANRFPNKIRIVALSAGSNAELLAQQADAFGPATVSLATSAAAEAFTDAVSGDWRGKILAGSDAAEEIAALPGVDVVINGIVGAAGLGPSLAALRSDRRLALANKESLVMAGSLIRRILKDHPSSQIFPVDSEHSAIAQCLLDRDPAEIKRIILTASGGPFREFDTARLEAVTPAEALDHPTWQMGPRITIDSATLFNKGMELIEAHWLFNIPMDQISVLVHPQSLVHGLIETVEGSLIAQISTPDMGLPIQLSLSYPEHWGPAVSSCNLASLGRLDFAEADEERFPALTIARQAGQIGGVAPAVLNGADEVLVSAFLAGKISFTAIAEGLAAALDQHHDLSDPTLEDILASDAWAREAASEFVSLHGMG